MNTDLRNKPVLVVGAGIMGSGIAQVAAQAGHPVLLFDTREGAALQAIDKLSTQLQALVAKGKLEAAQVAQTLSRIGAIGALPEAAGVALVVEAIVESLQAKRSLFRELEALVHADCILATNTSSISVTAIANGLAHPARLVGMHFFNPVPVMKLVEVVSGLQTDAALAQAIFDLSAHWGKVPVHARSTPGFIVNRIARPFYAETLALLQAQASTPAVLDACMRAAGFRMGPCELMDLIGHDTNFAVTQSVYEANFFDKRYVPSMVQRDMVDGGLLGRKAGRGFYDYALAARKPDPSPRAEPERPGLPAASKLSVHGRGLLADWLMGALDQAIDAAISLGEVAAPAIQRHTDSDWLGLEVDGCQLRLTDGRCATQLGKNRAVFDLPLQGKGSTPGAAHAALAWAPSALNDAAWTHQAALWLQLLGFEPQRVADTPGLVVARTLAMLINEGCDAVHQGVCTESDADAAMKLGLNYPAGPFQWLALWGAQPVCAVLRSLDAHVCGERYRISPLLQQAAWLAKYTETNA